MGRKLYDRQKERIPVLRGAELATLKQIVRADTTFDITTKSINNLSDVFSSMVPSDGERLTYDTTNGWQNEAAGLPLTGGTLTGSLSVNSTTAIITSGTGTPESVVTAPVGSMFLRTDGGAATTLYIKETGTGNTGWVGK
jgi:hypothetical protein